ncbi:aldehyde dehydrogenase family protein [Catenovulum sediminis]|uniref:Aldehyde dehydrogenase family protein n=1 Tax=Catenovulum sediminis TaxID=1740262 RepID=A0ABV1RD28_9ALTE|nr:aldehyde dehydrogenase family protein [Catenovulum sediminis]
MSTIDWSVQADTFKPEVRSLINGQHFDADGELYKKTSPIDLRSLSDIAILNEKEVNIAVNAARKAYNSRCWAGLPLTKRKEILFKFSDLINQHVGTLALLDCLEMGKSIHNLMYDDIPTGAASIRWFAEALDKVYDHCAPARDGALGTITSEPLGVVGAIIPWNYPMIMLAWKIAPALAMGNSVVLKPAEQSTYSAIKVAELALEAGIPPGVFNVVTGDGRTGQALASHMDVDGIFFTGSTEVGKLIMQYAAQSNLKKVALECGGKSPFIVLNSSKQLEYAAQSMARHVYFNQGQICSAASRLIIQAECEAEFLALLKQQINQYQPANPLLTDTRVGAMVSHQQLDKVVNYVEMAVQSGAEVFAGGKAVEPVKNGAFYQPTILTGVRNDMPIAQEEIFGPVVSVIRVKDTAEAVQVANQTKYGLAAAVWTDDFNTAHQVASQLRAGTVHVNAYGEDDATVPFGGMKQSGLGKDKSIWSLQQYAEMKTTWFRYS